MIGIIFILDLFLSRKEQNVCFQKNYQRKPIIIERQFSQNVSVFMLGTGCIFNWFLVKKERNVIFQADLRESPL